MSKAFQRRMAMVLGFFSCLLMAVPAYAQIFKGTNAPGDSINFQFSIPKGVTNFTVTLPGKTSAYSLLYLKRGGVASETNFDYASRFVGTNYISLELPQSVPTNWNVRVSTPLESAQHAYTLKLETNSVVVRTTPLPVTKPLGFVSQGGVSRGKWNYFRLQVGTNAVSLKLTLSGIGGAAPALYVQKDRLPTISSFLKRGFNDATNVVHLADVELTEGDYFVGVYASSSDAVYSLRSQVLKVLDLGFDPGETHLGTLLHTNAVATGGDYYFKIRTESPSVGAWRTALTVLSGEADLYMSRGTIPSPMSATYKSESAGSDGFVLGSTQFKAGEEWYILVRAGTNAQWRLVSGAPYVMELGELSSPGVSLTNLTMGAEGWRFFKTTVASETLAWQVALGNATNTIYLKKTGVPLNITKGSEQSQSAPMLVVPPYLTDGQDYFVGFQGKPGQKFALVSRQQVVKDILFTTAGTNVVSDASGHTTFRVQVPPNEVAWQVNVVPLTGNPDLYVRRDVVGNENYNDAYSEVPGMVTDSIALVPPTLSDGTFFITIRGVGKHSFRLQTGRPTITDIKFSDKVVNLESNRVGWRFFRVTDIDAQLTSLGWEVFLSKFSPGTQIALRRNQAPGIWNYRSGTTKGTVKNYDFLSLSNILRRPDHQADVWYIGVYNPAQPLGPFTLTTRPTHAELVAGDGGSASRTNMGAFQWQFFRVDVPAGIQGWDVRLVNVSGGSPRMVIRREALPVTQLTGDKVVTTNIQTTLASPATGTNWPGGAQWVAGLDWTKKQYASSGANELGRVMAMGMGRPLEPATYYIGVYNAGGDNTSFTIKSRFIGVGKSIPLRDLTYAGGVLGGSLAPREAAYFRINIPANSKTWKVKLTVSSGEAMLVASTNKVPNVLSEKRVQKLGNEHFVLLPDKDQGFLRAGPHFLAVVGEGANSSGNSIGSGASSYSIQSVGPIELVDMGALDGKEELSTSLQTLEGGETKMYRFDANTFWPGAELVMENRVGNPVMVIHGGTYFLPDPGAGKGGISADPYGNLGGQRDPDTIGVSNSRFILEGIFGKDTLMVKARSLGGQYSEASFRLRLRKIHPLPLAFNGGSMTVTNHVGWKWYQIDVPASAVGWDIRLKNILGGSHKLVVAPYGIPAELATSPGFKPAVDPIWWGRWLATKDWTSRTYSPDGKISEDGRILACGMGRPLQPGTYYAGVFSSGGGGYTIHSRGIGSGMNIPVRDLAFMGGTNKLALPARQAAYYRVNVPAEMPSWKIKLETVPNGEATLMVLKDTIPNVLPSNTGSATNHSNPSRRLQKPGEEHFLLLPPPGQQNLIPGDYYIAVVGEGRSATNSSRIGTNSTTFTLTSVGPLPMIDLGVVESPLAHSNSISGGECVGYQFVVPEGTASVEARLENRIGNPVMVLRPGPLMPDPGMSISGVSSDSYGNEGGETKGTVGAAGVVTVANPTPGIFHLIVKARQTNSVHTNASFTLRISAVGTTPLAFDGGNLTVTNQSVGSWQYFQVVVPTNALGWDLRLTNVLSGLPKMVVRRDMLPGSLTSPSWGSPGNHNAWPSTNQWAAAGDWTRRQFSADGTADQNGRILAMGMGRPLEPGYYYVGVASGSGSAPMSYSIISRGIGDGFTIPVVEVPFENGSATNLSLPPREAAYFRVVVPPETPSWKLKLTGLSGESMMIGLKDFIPNVDYFDPNRSVAVGKSMQKAGNEQFLLLPPSGSNMLTGGTYFFAVASEGANPTANNRIGNGSSGFVVSSLGALPIVDLGAVSSVDIEKNDTLEGGEAKAYQFVVPQGLKSFEIKLENRVGNPVMVLSTNTLLPNPSASGNGLSTDNYGTEGGQTTSDVNPTLLTLPNPVPGTYSLIVKARSQNNIISDASYRLRIREIPVPELNFGSQWNTNGLTNVVSGILETNQRVFFRVEIPEITNGILGWKLELKHTSGLASVRVRKDLLPEDPNYGTPFASPAAYIVPHYLTNGTWFVEVRGQNATTFSLTSSPIELERPSWQMPAPGQPVVTPGVLAPLFADTGIGTNGAPLSGDASVFLDQGFQHYYSVTVPPGNGGLFRVQLDAISGNPDLYIRTNFAPTIHHSASGGTGNLYVRSLLAKGTQYANWVPMDGKKQTELESGEWLLMVRAAGNANARYRLRGSTGLVQNISINSGTLTNGMAGGDWRYYRVIMPADEPSWTVQFAQVSGDIHLYIRDAIPPGNGSGTNDIKHWGTDAKGTGPFPSFNVPGIHPIGSPPTLGGATYYLGFRALNDATFSFHVSHTPSAPSPALAAYSKWPDSNREGGNESAAAMLPVLRLSQLRVAPEGVELAVEGEPLRPYLVEFSTDLQTWHPLKLFTNDVAGFSLIHDEAAALHARFYRVRTTDE